MSQAADMDERITQGARHLLVDFGNDDLGRFSRGFGQADFHAQGAETMLIRRRDMDHGHIHRQDAVLEKQGEFRKQHRRKVGAAFLHRLAHIGADEQRVDPQVSFHLRLDIIAGANRKRLADFHIGDVRAHNPPEPPAVFAAPRHCRSERRAGRI